MRISYKLEKEDYFKFNLHHMENFPKIKRSITIQRFFMPIVFTIVTFFIYKRGDTPLTTILPVYIIVVLGWIYLYPRFLERSMKKRLDKILSLEDNKMLLEERTLEVNDEGIYEIIKDEKGNERSIFSSNEVIDVENSEESIYIYLTTESAYIIPKEFFKNDEELEEFISKVKKFKIKDD